MATMNVLDSTGATVAIEKPLAPGRLAAAASRPVVLSTEDKTALDAIAAAAADTTTASPIKVTGNDNYETVAASATDQAMGVTGAAGDRLAHVLIIPTTTSPGAVSIKDGGGVAITIFAGGATSVTSLIPFAIPLGLKSLAGAWKITTGANVTAIGVGVFT